MAPGPLIFRLSEVGPMVYRTPNLLLGGANVLSISPKLLPALLIAIVVAVPLSAQTPFSVTASAVTICAGGQVTLTATGDGADLTAWGVIPQAAGKFDRPSASATTTFTSRSGLQPGSFLHINAVNATGTQTTSVIAIGEPCTTDHLGGEIVRAVIGFEQLGSSGNPSNQDFSFDFFISRPIPFGKQSPDPWGKWLRWWGDVRIAGVPYTQNSSLATLSQQFTTTSGSQKVSQLAQSIEAQTGVEVRIASSGPHGSLTDLNATAHFALMWVTSIGATGPNNPSDNVTVYQAPTVGSSEAAILSKVTGVATCADR